MMTMATTQKYSTTWPNIQVFVDKNDLNKFDALGVISAKFVYMRKIYTVYFTVLIHVGP